MRSDDATLLKTCCTGLGPADVSTRSPTLSFSIWTSPPGVSTGEAMLELERIAAELPEGIGYE